jgi:iron complex transport system substrate-binding protein
MMTPSAATRRTVLRWSGAGALAGLCSPGVLAQSHAPRLVTVGGAITEVAYLLGAQDQLVGTDTTSLFPVAAQKTPKVGYMRQLSAEGLLSLQPDALISTTEAGPPVVLDQIRSAGVRLELVEADHSWMEVGRKVAAVGRAASRMREARALQEQLDDAWAEVQRGVAKTRGQRPRVLFILAHSQSPSVSGEATAADAVMRYCGSINCMSGFRGYRPMTAEAMASAAPDVILTTTQGVDALGGVDKFWARPELALTPAYARQALVQMDALKLIGFGPRLPEAVRELHERVVLA